MVHDFRMERLGEEYAQLAAAAVLQQSAGCKRMFQSVDV